MKEKLFHSSVSMTLFCVCAFLLVMVMSPESSVQACGHDSGDDSGTLNINQVLFGPLRVRAEPNGDVIEVLLIGDTFVVTEFAEAGGYLWGRHELGWTALHTLDCNTVYAASPDHAAPTPDPAGDTSTGAGDTSTAASDSPIITGDNLCHTVWTFCNTGTPEQIAYYWRLGWYAAEVQQGKLAGDPARLASGATPVPTPVPPERPPETTPEP